MIDVYWIGLESKPHNGFYERDPKDVVDALESLDYGEGFVIRRQQMAEKDYLALPEFMGF